MGRSVIAAAGIAIEFFFALGDNQNKARCALLANVVPQHKEGVRRRNPYSER